MAFRPFPTTRAPETAALPPNGSASESALTLAESAVAAMVDFARTCPVTTHKQRHIDDALKDMIAAGVRTLIVLDKGAVVGLITSYDIQGERPLQFLQSGECIHGTCLHRDITVDDIMTPLAQLPVLDYATVLDARVGDIHETFKASSQRHLVVVEQRDSGVTRVRGLISLTHLERRLGVSIGAPSAQRVEHDLALQITPFGQR